MGIYNTNSNPSNETMRKVSAQQSNSGFVPDENYTERTFPATTDVDNRYLKKEVFMVDLKENKEKESNEDYDPYQHRDVKHPTTNAETLLHLLKGCLGTGILAMPKAFSNAGYLIGVIGTILIGALCTYCVHLLIKCEYDLCKRRKKGSLTYPSTAEAAFSEGPKFLRKFAPYSGHMVNTFLLVYQLGTCCVYIVFIAANVQSVANIYIKELGIEIYMLIFLIPLILINWIRNLKKLAPLSTAANVITLASFGIIAYYLFTSNLSFDDKEMLGKPENFPLFLGTVLFALEAIGVIIPLENEMKTPKSFVKTFGVLNIGMVSIIILYFGLGLLGYLTYGKDVEGTITLNLPKDEVLAQVAKISLAIAIYITYGLQCYVAVDITWHQYVGPKLEKNPRQVVWEYVVRTVLVLITFVLAVSIPSIDLFISLFGALCLSALGIAIPAAIETCTYWYHREGPSFYLMLVKNLILILFGLIGLVAGTYTSIRDIIYEFS